MCGGLIKLNNRSPGVVAAGYEFRVCCNMKQADTQHFIH